MGIFSHYGAHHDFAYISFCLSQSTMLVGTRGVANSSAKFGRWPRQCRRQKCWRKKLGTATWVLAAGGPSSPPGHGEEPQAASVRPSRAAEYRRSRCTGRIAPWLAAAGKVVRIVDAAAADPVPTRATPASVPDFDPATQPICDRATFADMRDRLHNALLELELREQDVQRLEQRNALSRRRAEAPGAAPPPTA
jgi:hypothetical protein